jgi:hypothetical protein
MVGPPGAKKLTQSRKEDLASACRSRVILLAFLLCALAALREMENEKAPSARSIVEGAP